MKLKKIKSKKGFSLVELIVTVAILSITSLLLLGIVSNSITNYSTASVAASEQDIALQVEEDLVSFARRAIGMELIDIDASATPVPAEDETAFYIVCNEKGLTTITADVEMVDEPPVVVSYIYKGVKNLTLTLKKHKKEAEDTTSEARYLLVDYVIEMKQGYTLKGTVVMNNELHDYEMEVDNTESFVDKNEPIQLLPGTGNYAIKFKRNNN